LSNINYSDGKYILQDGERGALLADIRTPFLNRSRVHSHQFTEQRTVEYPLTNIVNAAANKIFKRTPETMAELVTYLRIVARLLRKPQVHTVLRAGQWSPLDESLAELLPQFNPANKLYCLSETRPLGKIPSVNFIFAEGEGYLLPENKFDTIIFPSTPPPEVLSAVKDYGRIYFIAQPWKVEELLKNAAQIFPMTEAIALFELEVTPQFRQELRKRTPQGRLDEKLSAISQTVAKVPAVLKKFNTLPHKRKTAYLDEYIAEVARAEKVLAEIFPALPSDSVKFNFNALKEFLIDLRLGSGSTARVNRQYEILEKELGIRN